MGLLGRQSKKMTLAKDHAKLHGISLDTATGRFLSHSGNWGIQGFTLATPPQYCNSQETVNAISTSRRLLGQNLRA